MTTDPPPDLPRDLVERLGRPPTAAEEGIWIHRQSVDELARAVQELQRRRREGQPLPLYGVPFAVKDNIDVAGLPTTAACPAFAYVAKQSAPVVTRLLDAGALLVGKTNLDQFATGLVGVRSPYGVPRNPFDDRYIVGGSSSGSAAAVARGLVRFALGTDTAGSGRIPAAFTNLVGWKPSPGVISTRGVVPACRSLDCVSVFASTVDDARLVAGLAGGYDPQDPYSRPAADSVAVRAEAPGRFKAGVPRPADREFFGDQAARRAFEQALDRLTAQGAELVEVDLAPFLETAGLLYDGPWIAERLAGLQAFVEGHPESLLPVTREILAEGASFPGPRVFAGLHRLAALRQLVLPLWSSIDTLVVPTAPTIYRIDEIQADPRRLNARLGRYVNFVNLLDLAAVAVPGDFRPDGLPSGISFLGPWGSEGRLGALAAAFHATVSDRFQLAVVGAHLSGEPLNHQLTELGGRLVRGTRTAPVYRLYALAGTKPPKPGLVRSGNKEIPGAAIEVEVWDLPRAKLGAFFRGVVSPLALGTLELEDGGQVAGFLCESFAVAGAEDISSFGGWRNYRSKRGP